MRRLPVRTIREYFPRARRECGVALRELARRAGIPYTTLHTLEAKRRPLPRAEGIARLTRAVGGQVQDGLVLAFHECALEAGGDYLDLLGWRAPGYHLAVLGPDGAPVTTLDLATEEIAVAGTPTPHLTAASAALAATPPTAEAWLMPSHAREHWPSNKKQAVSRATRRRGDRAPTNDDEGSIGPGVTGGIAGRAPSGTQAATPADRAWLAACLRDSIAAIAETLDELELHEALGLTAEKLAQADGAATLLEVPRDIQRPASRSTLRDDASAVPARQTLDNTPRQEGPREEHHDQGG